MFRIPQRSSPLQIPAQDRGIRLDVAGIRIGGAVAGIAAQDRHVVGNRKRSRAIAGRDARSVVRHIGAVGHADRVPALRRGQSIVQVPVGLRPTAAVRRPDGQRGIPVHTEDMAAARSADREVELERDQGMRALERPVAGGQGAKIALKTHGGLENQGAHRGRRALKLQLDRLGGIVDGQIGRAAEGSLRSATVSIRSVGRPLESDDTRGRWAGRIDRPAGGGCRPKTLDPGNARRPSRSTEKHQHCNGRSDSPFHRSTLSEEIPLVPIAACISLRRLSPHHHFITYARPTSDWDTAVAHHGRFLGVYSGGTLGNSKLKRAGPTSFPAASPSSVTA